ncbi:MAG: DUF1295 domain-containing protein [Flavobacteriales bacterium]|nr:DUF1295 domain-containing protein [Flavobacteriales bacterium]
MGLFPAIAPLAYYIFWEMEATQHPGYRDPLPGVVSGFLIAAWSLRKIFYWFRSWKTIRDAAAKYPIHFKPARQGILMALVTFVWMPLALAGLFSPLGHIVARPEELEFSDLLAVLMALGFILWDSIAEQRKMLHEERYRLNVRFLRGGLWRWVRFPELTGLLGLALSLWPLTGDPLETLVLPAAGWLAFYLYLRLWEVPLRDAYWLHLRPEYRAYMQKRPPLVPLPWLNL